MRRVLVIDDDAEVRRMVRRTLDKHGMGAIEAGNTSEALAVLSANSLQEVDAIILDLMLGRENGWETLRQMRAITKAPILLISGAIVDNDVRVDARTLGAQGVLQKPFEAGGLIGAIRDVFRD